MSASVGARVPAGGGPGGQWWRAAAGPGSERPGAVGRGWAPGSPGLPRGRGPVRGAVGPVGVGLVGGGWWRWMAAFLVVCLVGLGGCAGGSEDAGDAGAGASVPGGGSASPTPSAALPADQVAKREAALAMPAPVQPENMDEDSPAGAVATAEYFVQLYPYVYATGDLEQWRSMIRDDCLFCNSVVGNVKDLHNKGGWVDPWTHTVTQTQYVEPGPGSEYSRVDVVFDQDASYTYDGSGADPEVTEPQVGTTVLFAMKYEDGRWIIREGEPL